MNSYVSGRMTAGEREALERWLGDAAEHRENFAKYLHLYRLHRMALGGELIDEEKAWGTFRTRYRHRRRMRRIRRWGTAAAVALLLGGVGTALLFREPDGEPVPVVAEILPGSVQATLVMADGQEVDLLRAGLQEVREEGVRIANDAETGLQYDRGEVEVKVPVRHTVKVPVAGEYRFTLGDGTMVYMNSASEITFPVPFVADMREVSVKGEVYFEVRRDTARPFIVYAGGVAVTVLGTKFNVAAYAEKRGVETTLVEGSVRVCNGEQEVMLVPGEQAVASNNGAIVKRQVDTHMYISWMEGIFEFEAMPLPEIMEQLARWYDMEFRFNGEELYDRCFTGIFERNENLNDILEVIEKTTNVRFDIKGNSVVVKSV